MTRSGKLLAPATAVAFVLTIAAPASAQEFRGRITGVVSDSSAAVLPGVTVTAAGPALIQPQVAVTGEDGVYRLLALPAGVYGLTFELAGFRTLKREGIRVTINTTLTVNAELQVAAVEETVTVTGVSPVVDTSTNTVGTIFTKELLTEIPNARDIWAAMSQAPGFHMTGYDVGGSHTGTQTGSIVYGVSQQRTTRIEGINTTEAASANAGYFDFGSFEEFQTSGAGNMAEQDVIGGLLNVTVKSGGDRFSGMWYSDWEGDRTISNNVLDELKVTGGRTKDGFVAPPGGVQRGNQIDRQYDLNGYIGGPIWKGKAWFFYSYRLNDQYKYIVGSTQLAQSKLSNAYTLKGTFQLSRNNQLIGYLNKREKLQPLRDFGPTTPVSASRYQSSRNYPMKIEWTSILSNRAFLDVLVGQWYNFFPLRPTTENGAFPEDRLQPGRIDTRTNQRFDGGAHDTYQDRKRYKPQFTASLSYFRSGWVGSHDFKFGFEAKRDRRKEGRDQPFNIFYRDRDGRPNEVDIYNGPVVGVNDVNSRSAYVNDSWKVKDRLTINLGLRMDRYSDGWPDQSFTPGGVPQLRGDPVFDAFFAPVSVEAGVVARTTTWGPRVGFAYDLRGDGRSVVKGFYGRYYFNSADIIADNENPVGLARRRYEFRDNGNGQVDGPQELGRLVSTLGGGGSVTVDPNLKRPYGQEISGHFERELLALLSGRISYVYKNIRDDWSEVDLNRLPAYTLPFSLPDPSTGAPLSLLTRPAGIPERRVFTNPTDPEYTSDYHTIDFAVNRRFRGRWMAITSFTYSWLDQFNDRQQASTNALEAVNLGKTYRWRPNERLFGKERTTLWNYKLIGRYVFPWDIGVSGSYKLQSGLQWGRTESITIPNVGTETVRVEPANANRAPNVGIVDVRLDKSFDLGGRRGRMTGMVDVFNLLNDDVVTNFRIQGGPRFREIIGLLDPRIVRFGIRYEF